MVVDTANLSHIECPAGGASGGASISQSGYQNFAWHNVTNGQIYGNGPGVTSIQSLAAGLYYLCCT